MKNGIIAVNILIQVFWYVLSGIVTYFITRVWFCGIAKPWRFILGGFVFVLIVAVLSIITNIIKAMKDPDVQSASELRIPIYRYRKYKEWYDEHQRLMQKYGIESKEEKAYFISFFKQIKYPNEWRRYQNFRYKDIGNILNESKRNWRTKK